MTGIVKNYNRTKKYGYITAEDGEELYFYISVCLPSVNNIMRKFKKGDRVEYTRIEQGEGKIAIASNVRLKNDPVYNGQFMIGTISRMSESGGSGYVRDLQGDEYYFYRGGTHGAGDWTKPGVSVEFGLVFDGRSPKIDRMQIYRPHEDIKQKSKMAVRYQP